VRIRTVGVAVAFLVSLLGVGAPRAGAVSGLALTSVQPSSGHVGRVVTLTGSGFVAGDVVSFNGTSMLPSTVSADGTQLTVSVPLDATTGPITVSDPAGGQSSGPSRRPFRVTRGVAAPVGDYRGDVVSLRGSGFPPDQTLPVVLDKGQIGVARTDAVGAFDASVTVPWTVKPGKHRIGALVGTQRVSTVFNVFGDWPQAAHDAASSSDLSYEPSITPATVSGLQPRTLQQQPWPHPCSPPLIAEGILIESCGNHLNASDVATNAPLWTDQVGWVYTQAAIDHGVVYVGVTDSANGVYGIAALDLHSGAQDWATQLNQPVVEVIASAASVYATLGVTSFGGEVVALDAGSGQLQWSQSFSGSGYANGLIALGTSDVFVGFPAGSVVALDAASGAVQWTTTTEPYAVVQPVTDGTRVYVTGEGTLYALHATTGKQAWSWTPTSATIEPPAVANGVVYEATSQGYVALSGSSGATVWSVQKAGPPFTKYTPIVAGGVLYGGFTIPYVIGNDGTIAFDAASGTELFDCYGCGVARAVSNGVLFTSGGEYSLP
jgi:outer membrane protein assembly factor BamB